MAVMAEEKIACGPCHSAKEPLTGETLKRHYESLHSDWRLVDGHHLEKEFSFADFRGALAFTNRVGELAESVNHHPDIFLTWGKVKVTIWTHKVDGLTPADFDFAGNVDGLG